MVLVEPEMISRAELNRRLAMHSLDTVRWVVASTHDTIDEFHRDVFTDMTLFEGIDAASDMQILETEVVLVRDQSKALLVEVDAARRQNTLAGVDLPGELVWHAVRAEHVPLKKRAAMLLKKSVDLISRTDETLRTAGRDAIERTRQQALVLVDDLRAAGSYALRLAATSRARLAMKVITAVVMVGAASVGVIGPEAVAGGATLIAGALEAISATQDVLAEAKPSPPVPSGADSGAFVLHLQQLAKLYDEEKLTEEEFQLAKQRLLAAPRAPAAPSSNRR